MSIEVWEFHFTIVLLIAGCSQNQDDFEVFDLSSYTDGTGYHSGGTATTGWTDDEGNEVTVPTHSFDIGTSSEPMIVSLDFYRDGDDSWTVPPDGVYIIMHRYTENGYSHIEIGDDSTEIAYVAMSGTITISNSDNSGLGSYTLSVDALGKKYSYYATDLDDYLGDIRIVGTVDIVQIDD